MSSDKPTIHFELIAWATVFVGGDGSERKEFEEPLLPGDTVRTVLKRLSVRFPDLDKALWDRGSGELGEHIEIAVNDAVLGIRHNLNSEAKDGDTIILMGQYMGG
ncbi:MAG: MoaD/ThiS family protein [bacterium]|nr:MoaD/ThiS family protein [bacterium]